MTRTEQKMEKALNHTCILNGFIRDLRDTLGADDEEIHDELELAIYDVLRASRRLMEVASKCKVHVY